MCPREAPAGSRRTRLKLDRVTRLDCFPCAVVALLHDIEARDARFLETVARVFQRGFAEGFDAFRLHADLNVNDEHRVDSFLVRGVMGELRARGKE